MALDRYVRMREAYEKEQSEFGERKEPGLGESLAATLDEVDHGDDARDESVNVQGIGALSMAQKGMMGVSVLIVLVASVVIYQIPAKLAGQFLVFGARAPVRIMEMLQWNSVLMWVPIVVLLLCFIGHRRSHYLGVKMMVAAMASAVLLSCVSAAFSYFVMTVGA